MYPSTHTHTQGNGAVAQTHDSLLQGLQENDVRSFVFTPLLLLLRYERETKFFVQQRAMQGRMRASRLRKRTLEAKGMSNLVQKSSNGNDEARLLSREMFAGHRTDTALSRSMSSSLSITYLGLDKKYCIIDDDQSECVSSKTPESSISPNELWDLAVSTLEKGSMIDIRRVVSKSTCDTMFFVAAAMGDLESLRYVLRHHQDDVNLEIKACEIGWSANKEITHTPNATALWLAAKSGHLDIVKELLSRGANALYVTRNNEDVYSVASSHREIGYEIALAAWRQMPLSKPPSSVFESRRNVWWSIESKMCQDTREWRVRVVNFAESCKKREEHLYPFPKRKRPEDSRIEDFMQSRELMPMLRRVVIRVSDPSDTKRFVANQTITSPGIFSVNVPFVPRNTRIVIQLFWRVELRACDFNVFSSFSPSSSSSSSPASSDLAVSTTNDITTVRSTIGAFESISSSQQHQREYSRIFRTQVLSIAAHSLSQSSIPSSCEIGTRKQKTKKFSKMEKIKRLMDALDRDVDSEIKNEIRSIQDDPDLNVNMFYKSIVPLMKAKSASAVQFLLNAGARVFIATSSNDKQYQKQLIEEHHPFTKIRLPRLSTIQSVSTPLSPMSGPMSPQSLLHRRTTTSSSWDTVSTKTHDSSQNDLLSTMSSQSTMFDDDDSSIRDIRFFIISDENGKSVLEHAVRNGCSKEGLNLLRMCRCWSVKRENISLSLSLDVGAHLFLSQTYTRPFLLLVRLTLLYTHTIW